MLLTLSNEVLLRTLGKDLLAVEFYPGATNLSATLSFLHPSAVRMK